MPIHFEFTLEQISNVVALSRDDPNYLEVFRVAAKLAEGGFSALPTQWLAQHVEPPRIVCQGGVGLWSKLCARISLEHVKHLSPTLRAQVAPFDILTFAERLPNGLDEDPWFEIFVERVDTHGYPSMPVDWERPYKSEIRTWSRTNVNPKPGYKDFYIYYREKNSGVECLACWSGVSGQVTLYGSVSEEFLLAILS